MFLHQNYITASLFKYKLTTAYIFFFWRMYRKCLVCNLICSIFCFRRLPDDGTSVPKHVGADTHHELYCVTYILLYFIDCICWLIYCHTVGRVAQSV